MVVEAGMQPPFHNLCKYRGESFHHVTVLIRSLLMRYRGLAIPLFPTSSFRTDKNETVYNIKIFIYENWILLKNLNEMRSLARDSLRYIGSVDTITPASGSHRASWYLRDKILQLIYLVGKEAV